MPFLSVVVKYLQRIPKMLREVVIFLLIIGFVAEARFHGINPYQRLLSKCVIYLLNEYAQPVSYTHLTLPTIYSV